MRTKRRILFGPFVCEEGKKNDLVKILGRGELTAKLNITAHAGEAKGPESIWESIKKLQTKRIGHGVRCIEDPELVNYLSENDFQYSDCIYAQENFDCNGDCLLVVDYCWLMLNCCCLVA